MGLRDDGGGGRDEWPGALRRRVLSRPQRPSSEQPSPSRLLSSRC